MKAAVMRAYRSPLALEEVVFDEPTPFCGVCRFCTAGRPCLCPAQFTGRPPDAKPRLAAGDGGVMRQFANLSSFAEYMLSPERSLVRIRDDMPFDRASLIGCGVTTGLGAVLNTVRVPAGASVVVVGCGGVGLAAIQGARKGTQTRGRRGSGSTSGCMRGRGPHRSF